MVSLNNVLILLTQSLNVPLASETSIGAMDPKKSEGSHEDTKEIRDVALYVSGFRRRIYSKNHPIRFACNKRSPQDNAHTRLI